MLGRATHHFGWAPAGLGSGACLHALWLMAVPVCRKGGVVVKEGLKCSYGVNLQANDWWRSCVKHLDLERSSGDFQRAKKCSLWVQRPLLAVVTSSGFTSHISACS